MKFKNYMILTAFVFLILATFIIFASVFSYFDPKNLCYISIDNYSNEPPSGNRSAVRKAVKLLRDSDKEVYKNLCKYVDTIQEGYCEKPDEEGHFKGIPGPGCYIRGSKIIVILPDKSNEDSTIAMRSETIKKYALFSKNFWENRK